VSTCETFLRKLATIGCELTGEVGITAKGPARPSACDIATLPYPGVATDYKPLLVASSPSPTAPRS